LIHDPVREKSRELDKPRELKDTEREEYAAYNKEARRGKQAFYFCRLL
jgi:hypothetical protein